MRTYNLLYEKEGDLEELVGRWRIEDSDNVLVQIFTGIPDRKHIEKIQRELRALFRKAGVIGTTTGGEIYNGRVYERSTVVSVSVFEKSRIKTAISDRENPTAMAEELASSLREGNPRLIIAFVDGLRSNGDEVVETFDRYCPGAILAGGLAGDNFTFGGTFTFTAEEILPVGGVGASIVSPDLYVTRHYNLAWIPIGKEMVVTKAEGNRLYEIEGKPAVDIYKEYLGSAAEDLLPHIAIEFPLVFERDGVLLARACLGIDEDGAMVYEGNIKPGEKVHFSIWDTGVMLESTATAVRKFRLHPSESIFVYTCAARKYLMGSEVEIETKYLQDIAPTSGFLTYGEFYTFEGKSMFLNYTLTALSVSESGKRAQGEDKELTGEVNREPVRFRALVTLVNAITKELAEANRELKKLAERDTLTGLFNRRKMVELLENEIALAENYDRSFSLLMVDVDNFKSINDLYGHQTGDEVLVKIARLLEEELRETDVLARWGGEEFLILMRDTDLMRGMLVAQKLRSAVRRHFADLYEGKISLSVGVTTFKKGDTVNSLVRRADIAMYAAKQRGKDTIMSY